MPKPSFGLPSNVRADILFGVMRVAEDPDTNTLQDWLVQGAPLGMDRRIETTGLFPLADKPDKEDLSPTPDVSEQLAYGWGTFQVRARKPRRCAQRIRKVSCSSDCCGYRQRHARASLSERLREPVRTHYQGVARKAQIAPCRGYETFQRKRTSVSARASDPGRATLWQTGRIFQKLLL